LARVVLAGKVEAAEPSKIVGVRGGQGGLALVVGTGAAVPLGQDVEAEDQAKRHGK